MQVERLRVMPGKILGEILSNDLISPGGIVIPTGQVKEIPQKAKVLKVGPPKKDKKGKLITPAANVGDIAHFKKSFGFQWKDGMKNYIFLNNEDIIGTEVKG